ncbi:archease [Archaeoglobus veneficus]|uniref:Protein archease n=1 Tax=Archaeoglobus veneficus (strain DSM 11195 / SNP6) TaxID=693661 RepID=F2KRY4_ARCVS|nr:archease [Archaeoglobus veneficus]AEA46825.1 protein of unknown function DUF101 [Archaeoglobus veneficus SNP6]
MKYRFIDHTADIAFEVFGSSIEELIENATLAFCEAFAYSEKIEGEVEREVEVEGDAEDMLLYHWLNELLYLFDTEFFAAKQAKAIVEGDGMLKARGVLKGGKLTPEAVKVEPKAITLHNYRVEKRNGGWYAFVVVDI